jgi:ATP-dependent Clp endopeptidase proteolytic subunit ClpP
VSREPIVKKFDDFNAEDRVSVKLLENHTFYLSGEIDENTVNDCIKWIIFENLDSTKEKVLTLYINSTGGDLYHAFALIDIMHNSQHPVRTIGLGAVMSAAFLIFACGTNGQRLAGKNTSFMIHQYSDSLVGKHHDLKATMRDGELCNQKMINLLKEATGLAPSKIRSKLLPASDVYLTSEEVIELGVADHIFE